MKRKVIVGLAIGFFFMCSVVTADAYPLTYSIDGHGFGPLNTYGSEIYSGYLDIDLDNHYGNVIPGEYHEDSNEFFPGTYVFNIFKDYGDNDTTNDTTFTYSGNATLTLSMMLDKYLAFDSFEGPFYEHRSPLYDAYGNSVDWHTPDFDLSTILSLNFNQGSILDSGFTSAPRGSILLTQVAPVQEPSTLLLLSSGCAGLAWYNRRRKKT